MNPVPPLVCPFDLLPLTLTDNSHRCDAGHAFAVIDGISDLCVVEEPSRHLHHKPSTSPGGYEDIFVKRSNARRTLAQRLRSAASIVRVGSFWRQTVDRASPLLAAELNGHPPFVDGGEEAAFARGRHAHALTKRLEKELFWDDIPLDGPACELGVHDGHVSNYLFSGRQIEFGSNYVSATMRQAQSLPHRTLFSANIQFLPFAEGALQTVFCAQTLPVVYASIAAVLAEINRVLALGGHFAFTTHGPAFRQALPPEGWPEMGLSPAACRRMTLRRSGYMTHLYTAEEWHQLLALCGFDVVMTRGPLSTDYSRFVQLFYAEAASGNPPVVERYRTRLQRMLYLLGSLGRRRAAVCEMTFRQMMRSITAYELERHRGKPFDDRCFLDVGVLAVKRRSLAGVPRLGPRPVKTGQPGPVATRSGFRPSPE